MRGKGRANSRDQWRKRKVPQIAGNLLRAAGRGLMIINGIRFGNGLLTASGGGTIGEALSGD